ncbi:MULTISPECIES: relaxase/mobilization nuclease and DUF3363 domain-containing protein [Pseudomonadota]|uniref:Relaxase/mobilization nuclease and DUF3363 domain-containing protein n=1 Tax=Alcaligenes phenolicus TaxID=232846 RepID=A0AAW5VIC5_9BURK|nr:relaxase/mobilization nuclease and DUF3363 domain-containing protein [Alcaligenes phenolicus]MCX5563753.1 relaxase/mobilization nuclease and DUF3363 domain-containing protein [Alcaligenes phenolicus]
MTTHDDDRFRPRPAPPKNRGRGQGERFVTAVKRQMSRTGHAVGAHGQGRGAGQFGRGQVAARFASKRPPLSTRRVVIKSRFVRLQSGGAAVASHLRYIERDGVTPDGQPGHAYGPESDHVDTRDFIARSEDDRHQFRFIVSAEDARELGDLKDFTRVFMARMSVDLQTRLDWVAVDHWDTDNPHTHIVLRGRADNGQDLVIAPDYMGHGMRTRASEIVTEWLGPRTEMEIAQSLRQEVTQQRFTTLDRALLRQAELDHVDVLSLKGDVHYQASQRARLQHLSGLGLATQEDARHWRLSPRLESTLRELGERGDIIRTMHRAMRGEVREMNVLGVSAQPVVGRIAAKGLADELRDVGYLVVDGTDGRAHYVRLPGQSELADWSVGGIVSVKPQVDSAADRNILAHTRDGLYRAAEHLKSLGETERSQDMVQGHTRRLEALRRAGIVERLTDGVWKIPGDLIERGRRFDKSRSGGVSVTLRSHLPIADQTHAAGATWLDEQLIAGGKDLSPTGFGAKARAAIEKRLGHLEEQGLAQRRGQRVVLARNLLRTLRARELAVVGQRLQAETGLAYQPVGDDGRVSGIYRRSVMLASGRYAMLENGHHFTLVPWRPVIEPKLGQRLGIRMNQGIISWDISNLRTPSIG